MKADISVRGSNSEIEEKSKKLYETVVSLFCLAIVNFIFAAFIKFGLNIVSSFYVYGIKWAGYIPPLGYWKILGIIYAVQSALRAIAIPIKGIEKK